MPQAANVFLIASDTPTGDIELEPNGYQNTKERDVMEWVQPASGSTPVVSSPKLTFRKRKLSSGRTEMSIMLYIPVVEDDADGVPGVTSYTTHRSSHTYDDASTAEQRTLSRSLFASALSNEGVNSSGWLNSVFDTANTFW